MAYIAHLARLCILTFAGHALEVYIERILCGCFVLNLMVAKRYIPTLLIFIYFQTPQIGIADFGL